MARPPQTCGRKFNGSNTPLAPIEGHPVAGGPATQGGPHPRLPHSEAPCRAYTLAREWEPAFFTGLSRAFPGLSCPRNRDFLDTGPHRSYKTHGIKPMKLDRLTVKAQEALQEAQSLASQAGHPEI